MTTRVSPGEAGTTAWPIVPLTLNVYVPCTAVLSAVISTCGGFEPLTFVQWSPVGIVFGDVVHEGATTPCGTLVTQ